MSTFQILGEGVLAHSDTSNSQQPIIGAALLQFPVDATSIGTTEATWRSAIGQAHHAGFTHIDVTDSCIPLGDLSDSEILLLRRICNEFTIALSALSVTRKSILTSDQNKAKANYDYTVRAIDRAAELGIEVVCLGLHDQLTPEQEQATWFWLADGNTHEFDAETWDRAVTLFRELGEYAATKSIKLSLEMYEDTFLGTADQAVALIEAIGLDNVGLNPDIGNIVRLHRPIEDWKYMLETMLPYSNYWQLKNYYRDFDPATGAYFSAPAPLELGFIDYRWALQRATELGFNGVMCAEHYGGDGLSVSARNREYILNILSAQAKIRG